jgi:hypothetical protein
MSLINISFLIKFRYLHFLFDRLISDKHDESIFIISNTFNDQMQKVIFFLHL